MIGAASGLAQKVDLKAGYFSNQKASGASLRGGALSPGRRAGRANPFTSQDGLGDFDMVAKAVAGQHDVYYPLQHE